MPPKTGTFVPGLPFAKFPGMTDECRAEYAVLVKRSQELEMRAKEFAISDRPYSQSDFDVLQEQLVSHRAALEDFRARCLRLQQRETSTV